MAEITREDRVAYGPIIFNEYIYDNEIVVRLTGKEAVELQDLLNTHPALHEDYPSLANLELGLCACGNYNCLTNKDRREREAQANG